MARTLYIHVGPIKTGTSAIQNVMIEHDDSVVIYPKVGIRKSSHHTLVLKFFGDYHQEDMNEVSVQQLFEEISSRTKNSNLNVLISSEFFTKVPYSMRRDIEWCRDVGAFVNALMPYMSEAPLDVEILLACREHFAWVASAYSQNVKTHTTNEKRSPDEFLASLASRFLYAPLVRELSKTGFKVTALNYHPSHEWVERFLMHVGFSEDQIPKPPVKNISLSPRSLIGKLAANNVLQTKEERRFFLKKLKKLPDSIAGSQFIFGAQAAAEAEHLFAEDRKFLRDEFQIEFPVRDLSAQENMFYLDEEGMADIVAVAKKLENHGDAIAEFARGYLRV